MKSSVIPDWENYTIYENGDVYSKKRQGGGGKLKHSLSKQGYLRVSLFDKDKKKSFLLHRLLGLCFIENPDNKPCIDHIDRNRQNNSLDNLRWVTYAENNRNRANPKGSIMINKCYFNERTYEYIKFTWYENGKRKSKNFKTIEDAEAFQKEYQDNLKG